MCYRMCQRALFKDFFAQQNEACFLNLVNARFLRNTAGAIVRPKKVKNVGKGNSAVRNKQFNLIPHTSVSEEIDGPDELDYIAHSITTHGSKHSNLEAEREKTQELLRLNSFMRLKTLENKYFKPPKKPNLLTWACKEQIRCLHQNDPDNWSCERLAQIFPVSETSVKKILKSRVRLHRLIDVKEHDLFVKRNWEEVFNSLMSNRTKMYDDATQDILVGIGNTDNIINIFPLELENEASKMVSLVPKKTKSLGTFSSIVKDELERKESENIVLRKNHQEQLDLLKKTVLKIQEILSNSKIQDRKSKTKKDKDEVTLKKSKQSYKIKEDPFEFSVLKNSDKTGSTYLVDGCVYDENGEFLYKIH